MVFARQGKPGLLFEIAAILSTSANAGSVVEAFAVRQNSAALFSHVVVDTAVRPTILPELSASPAAASASVVPGSISPAALPEPFVAPSPRLSIVPAEQLTGLTGRPLLQQLAMLSRPALASFIAANPDVVNAVIASPPSARTVASWWTSLGATQQVAMRKEAPQLVGNLDGVPFSVRNTANREFLKRSIETLQATIAADPGRGAASVARGQLHMLDEISAALGTPETSPRRTLMSVDPGGQGRAAIILGDLATADYVSYMIPGMWFTVDGQIGDWTDSAARLYVEQKSWLTRLNPTDPVEATKSVAVVAWMGYETPNLTNVGSLDLAYQGRDSITAAIKGLQAVRADNQPYVSLLAHSYGSTAVLMALAENDITVDALALVGSPGSAARSIEDLNVRDGNVYVGEAVFDFVPNSSFFGSDPGSASYGAHPMSVDGGIDPITRARLGAALLHNDYFTSGTESMRNMALIGIDRGGYVTAGDATPVEVAARR